MHNYISNAEPINFHDPVPCCILFALLYKSHNVAMCILCPLNFPCYSSCNVQLVVIPHILRWQLNLPSFISSVCHLRCVFNYVNRLACNLLSVQGHCLEPTNCVQLNGCRGHMDYNEISTVDFRTHFGF